MKLGKKHLFILLLCVCVPLVFAMTREKQRKVAIFVFDGVQIIDFTGPYEVFGQAFRDVYTVAAQPGPVTTSMGMSVNQSYSFANAPRPDILVLPGGEVDSHLENPEVLRWIKESSKDAEIVLSVCNGAFYLARAGLLDGLEATTFAPLIPELQRIAPKTRVVSDKRFVDNGKIITTTGLSSGLDGSIHVIDKLLGRERAERLARHLEYRWQPGAGRLE